MVLRSLPRCRAIAEIVQPWRRNACTSMSSSRVSMSGGAPLSWCVVRDHQPQGSPACLGGATRVGIFSEQVWGLSHERHQRIRTFEAFAMDLQTSGGKPVTSENVPSIDNL